MLQLGYQLRVATRGQVGVVAPVAQPLVEPSVSRSGYRRGF